MDQQKTVILIHGHGVDSTIWDGLHEALSADFRLIKPDFSTISRHETVEAYAEQLYSMLQTAQVDKAILIGHSMGGYIALAFAERHADMVSGLVLFNSTVFADDEARKAKRQEAIQKINQQGSAAFIEEAVPKMFSEASHSKHPELISERVKIGNELPPDALVAGICAIAARPDRSKIIQEASFPVLIIAGKEDTLIPFEKSREMEDLLNEHGQFVALDDAGHLGMLEKPEESLTTLRTFLVRV